jgi:hypothetical protein
MRTVMVLLGASALSLSPAIAMAGIIIGNG